MFRIKQSKQKKIKICNKWLDDLDLLTTWLYNIYSSFSVAASINCKWLSSFLISRWICPLTCCCKSFLIGAFGQQMWTGRKPLLKNQQHTVDSLMSLNLQNAKINSTDLQGGIGCLKNEQLVRNPVGISFRYNF